MHVLYLHQWLSGGCLPSSSLETAAMSAFDDEHSRLLLMMMTAAHLPCFSSLTIIHLLTSPGAW
jgi:hypothetical protein